MMSSAEMDVNQCNDYVLIHLFGNFSLKQLFQRRRVCLRWKAIIETILTHRKSLSFMTCDRNYSPKWHSSNDYDISDREYITIGINGQQLDHILSKCQNLLSLDFIHKTINYSITKAIANRCHRLVRLDLSFSSGVTCESLLLLANHLINLKHVLLINCDISDSQLNIVLTQFKKLESLDISCNYRISGECFNNFGSNMRSLNILNCNRITNKAIISLMSSNGSYLKKLFIGTYDENSFITDSLLKYICLHLEDLQELHCIYDVVLGKGLPFISKFKGLRVLILTENKYENNNEVSIDDNSITSIMKECNQLTRFELTSVCGQSLLTDESLSQMNRFCPLIERLHIESFFKISSQTLYSISKLSNLWYIQFNNLNIDDNGIIDVLQSCQRLRYFGIKFTDKMFAFSHKITAAIVLTAIEVANQRSGHQMVFRVFGACLPSLEDLSTPENLTLQIESRHRV